MTAVRKVEVTSLRSRGEESDWCIQTHSILNMVNVVLIGLETVESELQIDGLLAPGIAACESFASILRGKELTRCEIRSLDQLKMTVTGNLAQALEAMQGDHGSAELPHYVKTIEDTLEVFGFHIRELRYRLTASDPWRSVPITEIRGKLVQVIDIMSRQSRGRYWVRYDDEPRQKDTDYVLHMRFRSPDNTHIRMPDVLQDTVGDLTCNARKFTEPGGEIITSLIDDGDAVELTVKDNGRGIPAEEIERVIQPGERASNTSPVQSRGGGFGLTKAHALCKLHDARMWIESGLNAGTVVTLRIPHV